MISKNLNVLRESIAPTCKLIAVSKTHPVEAILEAYHAGQRAFGENKAVELRDKHEALPSDIQWHFIGHLQSNKIKYIAPFVHLIHSVDSLKLMHELEKEALKTQRTLNVLLQLYIAQEDSKFGLDETELLQILQTKDQFPHVSINGLMGIASNSTDESQIRSEFQYLNDVFKRCRNGIMKEQESFKECSMGMSHDYRIAMACGSTMLRIGSTIFGERDYSKNTNS